jgi:hypothetical protein
MTSEEHRRFRLRYSLRLLLILMLVAAVLVAWCAAPIRRQRAAVARLAALGADIGYADDHNSEGSTLAGQLAWWLVGVQPVWSVTLYGPVRDDDLWALDDLPHLRMVQLAGCTELTDVAIMHLIEHQRDLETIGVGNCPRITPDALKQLIRLTKLKRFVTHRMSLPQVNTTELQQYFRQHGIEMWK